jgi:uncharacterized membrane protein
MDSHRIPGVDVARGLALLAMFVFHFCFDLNYFGFLHQDFYNDWRWIAARSVILSSFLILVGIGLVLGHGKRIHWPEFWRRWLRIAGCALLVTAGTWYLFPDSWIFFGVLHFIALASLLALPLMRRPLTALLLGITLIALGILFRHHWFDESWAQWLGMMTHKPRTEDYVPLVPWLGVVFIGIFASGRLRRPPAPQLQRATAGRICSWLALAGRHSLLLYMIHQPIFLGLLYLLRRAAG